MRNRAEVEPLFRQALPMFTPEQLQNSAEAAEVLNNLSLLLIVDKRLDQGLTLTRQAYETVTQLNNVNSMATVQGSLMLIYAESNPEPAIFYGKQSINSVQKIRAELAQGDSEALKSYTQEKSDTFHKLIDLLIKANRLKEADQVHDMLSQTQEGAAFSPIAYMGRESERLPQFQNINEQISCDCAGAR